MGNVVERSNTVVFIKDQSLRHDMYLIANELGHSIPVAAIEELGRIWPQDAWFVIDDCDDTFAELIAAFAARGTFYPIVVCSKQPTSFKAVNFVFGGAMNYIAWPISEQCLHDAMKGHEALARQRCAATSARYAARSRLSRLSQREIEVLRAVRQGLSSRETGLALGISHRTVEIHRANALAKLGATSTIAAVIMLIEAENANEWTLAADAEDDVSVHDDGIPGPADSNGPPRVRGTAELVAVPAWARKAS